MNPITLLTEGDVIILKKGMTVYGEIPSMFVISNRKTSKEPTTQEIVVGEKYTNDTNIKPDIDNIIKGIIERFDYRGFTVSKKNVKQFVLANSPTPRKETFILKGGEFLVVKTEAKVADARYKITLSKLTNGKFDKNATKIFVYQTTTGNLYATTEIIKPIRKMELTFQ
jgi:hypothetical protein